MRRNKNFSHEVGIYLKFCELTVKEYDGFVNNHLSHYTQMDRHYMYRVNHDMEVYLVGVKKDGEVIAASLINSAHIMRFFKFFYLQRGPVMDYQDESVVQCFYDGLTAFAKEKKAVYVLSDPYIVHQVRDHDGNILESKNTDQFLQQMKSLGYHHQGFHVGYSMKYQARWLSVLDIQDKSLDDILQNMDYNTRRSIKQTYKMGVQMRDLSLDEFDQFFELFEMAADKHGFDYASIDYFKRQANTYGDQCRIVMSYINLSDYLNELQEELADVEGEYNQSKQALEEKPNHKKLKNKTAELEMRVGKIRKKIEDTETLKASDGEVLNLASAMFIHNAHELYYLSSGSNPKYKQFMAPYNMMWEMIQYAKELGLQRYNFYGVSGDFSEDSDDYGVLKFKKGFNPVVHEMIGDFEKPIRPILYKLYKLKTR